MALSRTSRLIGLISKKNVRKASYINPKFEGGRAKPHEVGKNIRQKLFEKGEMFFFIPAFIVAAGAVLAFGHKSKHFQNFHQDRFDDWRTVYNYPYPERDESGK